METHFELPGIEPGNRRRGERRTPEDSGTLMLGGALILSIMAIVWFFVGFWMRGLFS